MGLKLNLGSGQHPQPGFVNVDKLGEPDLKCDLEVFPWPWPENSVSEILLIHVLEHLPTPNQAGQDILLREMPVSTSLTTRMVLEITSPGFIDCRMISMGIPRFYPRPISPPGILQTHPHRMTDPGSKGPQHISDRIIRGDRLPCR